MTTEAEAGVTELQAKDGRPPAAARKGRGRALPQDRQGESGLADTSISDLQPPELGDSTFLLV